MALLKFTRYAERRDQVGETIHVNPAWVTCVEETHARPSDGFYREVAVIHLNGGSKVTVEDSARKASARIRAAMEDGTDAR